MGGGGGRESGFGEGVLIGGEVGGEVRGWDEMGE